MPQSIPSGTINHGGSPSTFAHPTRTSAQQELDAAGREPGQLLSARAPAGDDALALWGRGVGQVDRLQLRSGSVGATVNDVEVHGPTSLHPGDVLGQAELQYLVLPAPARTAQSEPALLEHWAWQRRLEEEVTAGDAPFAILLGRSGAFTPAFLSAALGGFSSLARARQIAGAFGRNALEVLIIGDPAAVDSFRQFVSERAARDEETVRWGAAWFPRHGATAEELWSVAVDRLLGLEAPEVADLVWSDPCMSRLRAFGDRWARRPAVALVGAEGVGRESLARLIAASGKPGAPFIVHRGARFDAAKWTEDVARAAGGCLHVRRLQMLPEGELRAFWGARSFRPSAGVAAGSQSPRLPEDRIAIPGLADRPADVVPISELVLHAVDAQLGRRRTSLRSETRSLLQGLPAQENFRTLRNVVIRGALTTTSAEVRAEHLDVPVVIPTSAGVRAKVRETERREIEAALYRSEWNVTEAARRMELPRRTLVYRMARLGLRRPDGAS